MEKPEELEEMMIGVCQDVVDDLSREINSIEEDIKVHRRRQQDANFPQCLSSRIKSVEI